MNGIPTRTYLYANGVLSIRRISIRRIPIIGLGIGLGLGLGIGFGELKFGELKRNHANGCVPYFLHSGHDRRVRNHFLFENWAEELEKGGKIDVIYTDFEKAFDKIPPHRIHISKLYSYGIN